MTGPLIAVHPSLSAAGPFEWDYKENELTEQMVRDMVYQESLYYHPESE